MEPSHVMCFLKQKTENQFQLICLCKCRRVTVDFWKLKINFSWFVSYDGITDRSVKIQEGHRPIYVTAKNIHFGICDVFLQTMWMSTTSWCLDLPSHDIGVIVVFIYIVNKMEFSRCAFTNDPEWHNDIQARKELLAELKMVSWGRR